MSRVLMVCAIAIVLGLCPLPRAIAQGSADRPMTTVLLDLGFGGDLPAGSWAPVRIAISPMDNAIEGVARIVIATPGGDGITTLVPVATTPGKETIVPTTLWVPPSIASITVELVEQGGRRVASSAYGAVSGAQSITLKPPTVMPIILGVGSPSLRLAFGAENYQREFFGPEGELLRARAAVARVASAIPQSMGGPIWLPPTPMAYQGLAVVVIDGSLASILEPDGLRAMREWLISGGRVVIVNADNTALRLILGEHLPRGLSASAASMMELPASLGGPGEIASHTFDSDTLPAGWKRLADAQGLVAQGPLGLGVLMVVGFDPDELADAGMVASTEVAWHGTLATMVMDRLEHGRKSLGNRNWDDQPLDTLSALNALDWVSRAPTVGVGAFMAIFAMMLGLAIALGPVDRLVLKRLRALHRWWLAALAWITLATIGAWLLPARVRSGPTNVSSVRVIDTWRPQSGPVRAWQSSIDGIFMNRSATIDMDDLDQGSWLSPMPHPWQHMGMGSLVMTPTGSVMKPRPTTARLWTVRNFQQHGVTTPPVAARVEVDGGRYTLRLGGPMAGAGEVAAVRVSGQWLHLMPGATPRREGDLLVLNATLQDLTLQAPRSFDIQSTLARRDTYRPWGDAGPREPEPGLMLHLRHADGRGPAFEALSDSDQWAVVYLKWTDQSPLVASDVGETFSTMWVCRLAVPVEGTP